MLRSVPEMIRVGACRLHSPWSVARDAMPSRQYAHVAHVGLSTSHHLLFHAAHVNHGFGCVCVAEIMRAREISDQPALTAVAQTEPVGVLGSAANDYHATANTRRADSD